MPKRTPKQERQALTRQLEKQLPTKPSAGGETVVPDALIRKAIKKLEK